MGKTIILNRSITDSIIWTKANTNAQVDIHIDGKKITTINIKATITHTNGSTIKDALKANIQLNGKTIANNIDINTGQLTYAYNIPTGSPSNNKITITIQETSKYNTRSATTTLKISKDYQFINLEKTTITTTQKSKITITGNITDKNPINNAQINIKIAETDTGTITNSNGKFNHEHTITQKQRNI